MKKRLAIICVLAMVMVIGTQVLPWKSGTDEGIYTDEATQVNESERLVRHATVSQTMHFLRCNHQVERRINIPEVLTGAALDTVTAYYELWHIQSMEKDRIVMERHIDLYCPAHVVISLDGAGQVVLAENRYGDGMAILKTLDAVPEADEIRKTLIAGVGFDSEQAAMDWLREHGLLNDRN